MSLQLQVEMGEQFEECLELKWSTSEQCREFFIEMALDRSVKGEKDLKPAKDATVKRVNMGRDTSGCIQNMPEGRNFLVRVIGKLQLSKVAWLLWQLDTTCAFGFRNKRNKHRLFVIPDSPHLSDPISHVSPLVKEEVCSAWTRAATLSPKTRDKDLGNLDPMNMPRASDGLVDGYFVAGSILLGVLKTEMITLNCAWIVDIWFVYLSDMKDPNKSFFFSDVMLWWHLFALEDDFWNKSEVTVSTTEEWTATTALVPATSPFVGVWTLLDAWDVDDAAVTIPNIRWWAIYFQSMGWMEDIT